MGAALDDCERENLLVENVVVAVLAAGGYRLDRAFRQLDSLRLNNLTDPMAVRALDEGAVFLRLIAAGYDRGPVVTASMAKRLVALHEAIRAGTVDRIAQLIDQGKDKVAEQLAVTVPGVGPKVFRNFVLLHRGSGSGQTMSVRG